MEQRISRTKILGFFDTLGDLILCNALWILCSLPLVTIGAAYAALYTCVRKILAKEGVRAKDFFAAFKRCFKPASGAWLLLLALFALIAANVYILPALQPRLRSALIAFLGVVALVMLLWGAHIFPLIAADESQTSFSSLITTAFALGIRYLPQTILAVFVLVLPAVLFIAVPGLFLYACAVYAVIGVALTCLYHGFVVERIWKKARNCSKS